MSTQITHLDPPPTQNAYRSSLSQSAEFPLKVGLVALAILAVAIGLGYVPAIQNFFKMTMATHITVYDSLLKLGVPIFGASLILSLVILFIHRHYERQKETGLDTSGGLGSIRNTLKDLTQHYKKPMLIVIISVVGSAILAAGVLYAAHKLNPFLHTQIPLLEAVAIPIGCSIMASAPIGITAYFHKKELVIQKQPPADPLKSAWNMM